MSAPRRLLEWLWAAAWLRWRLARVKASRLFGGRAVADGLDYHLAPAEIPVEGVDYDPTELPAHLTARLEAVRAELLGRGPRPAATSNSPRARRRRVAALATAALLGLGAVGAGAAALVTGSTGVPAVDRLLGIYETDVNEPGSSGRPEGTGRDLQPRSSDTSTSIEVPLGSRRIVSTSYVSKDGRVCTAVTDTRNDDRGGYLACLAGQLLATRLAQEDGTVLGAMGEPDAILIGGFVTDRVTDLHGRGASGPLDVHLGETWSPDIPGVVSLKPFVAVGGLDGDRSQGRDPLVQVNPESYRFYGKAEDGEVVRIGP